MGKLTKRKNPIKGSLNPKRNFIIGFVLVTAFATNLTCAQPTLDDLDKQNAQAFFAFPVKAVVLSYRNILGKGVKSFCPMAPSCSTYGLQALDEYGAARGSLAIVDRLNRCGHDLHLYPHESTKEGIRFLDPVHKK